MSKKWTYFEEQILEQYYFIEGPSGIQERLPDRSKSAIQAKATQLGLTYNKNKNNIKKSSRSKTSHEKNKLVSFLLCLCFGYLGAHKFYEGDKKLGKLYLFTLGLMGIGWITDLIILFIQLIKKYNYYV